MPKYSILTVLFIMFLSLICHGQKYPGLAPTPPMGWNSWNFYYCNINEAKIRHMADAMASNGMKEAGYQYIIIDDCWQVSRDKDGYIIADPKKFPSGIKALADYVHSKGLKFGIYSAAGRLTCQKRPGSDGYEYKDAQRYAEWGVDYLKYDWCTSAPLDPPHQYSTMRDALHHAGRPIVYSIADGGYSRPWLWADTVGHLWRSTRDIQRHFAAGHGVLCIFDEMGRLRLYNKPNAWNDPDMLQVGNLPLNFIESRTHFTLWCMMASPLIAGNNLAHMKTGILKVLTDKNAIAIDQDRLGIPCFLLSTTNGVEAWIKPLADGSYAVCFFNRNHTARQLDITWPTQATDPDYKKTYDLSSTYSVFDIWGNKAIGTTRQKISARIKGEDVLFVLLKKE